ncbi:MAG: adenylate/guanylate cyclase domain-containing protein [Rhodospirillaceae bacterium]|nr:adenylate/guanylate cyclase domain-containing protein [Rhodospirillales bacterium]
MAIFLLVMLPLTAIMTGVLYRQNSQLATEMAETAMQRATTDTVVGVRNIFEPIARMVDLSVTFGKVQRDALRHPDAWRPLFDELEQLPNLYSLYFGFARDGGFLQVVRLPENAAKFGPRGEKPPENARYVLRLIDSSSGEMADSYIYLAAWGQVVKVERAPELRYDPRKRPWYEAAAKTKGVVNSGVYVFSGTGRPGLTLSRQITTEDGAAIGVFGTDLSIDTLARFLDGHRVGKNGIVFIMDEDGRLIGYPDLARTVVQENDRVVVTKADAVADPVVAGAVRMRQQGAGDRFQAKLEDGNNYLVSFSRFPEDFGRNWTIGVVASEADFVGPLRQASVVILIIGAIFLTIASFAVVAASRLLTRPINALIAETLRIRQLDLDSPVAVNSNVTELHALSTALDSMKMALRNFGTYVPKDLVREIVASGAASVLGGSRRPLTLMFSDLEGFTQATEALSPEDVLADLSEYFEVMSQAIHGQGGVIDKFIGDGIMAQWNAPVAQDDHVAAACHAVLACRRAEDALNEQRAQRQRAPLRTRFGLNTGVAVIGNVGSRSRMQYTALGQMVNLAARIEGLNKYFNTQALVSAQIESAVRGRFLFRPFGRVLASGTRVPVTLFELLDDTNAENEALAEAWAAPFTAWQDRRWAVAEAELTNFLNRFPRDGAAQLLLDHCRAFQHTPPAADWDGVLHFNAK